MVALIWHRTSAYSIAAFGTDYAVSRAVCLDTCSGELVERWSAWVGPPAPEPPRGHQAKMPELLGVRASAAAAKALCDQHRITRGEP